MDSNKFTSLIEAKGVLLGLELSHGDVQLPDTSFKYGVVRREGWAGGCSCQEIECEIQTTSTWLFNHFT